MGTQPTVNGPVTVPGKVTITPIYWGGTAGASAFPTGYASTINQYISDVAADSGKSTNVYGVLPEYSVPVNGVSTPLVYNMKAGPAIYATNAYPAAASQCGLDPGFTTCIPQTSIRNELTTVFSAKKLTPSLGQLYIVFYPPNVEVTESGTSKSTQWCGAHQQGFTSSTGRQIVYSDEAFTGQNGCASPGNPNITNDTINNGTYQGYQFGDWAINALAHEILEAITDPGANGQYGFFDNNGQEIGDECSYIYGKPLGYTIPGYDDTVYNQVINGHDYYTQLGYSNKSFASAGDGRGCIPGAFGSASAAASTVRAHAATSTSDVGSVTVNSSQANLPADGTATATVTVTVTDTGGNPVAGDAVGFVTTDANQGMADAAPPGHTPFIETGQCGTIASPDPGTPKRTYTTNADGQVSATYTASTDNGACSILATDVTGGTSNDTVIYQGSSDQAAPTLTQTVPTSLAGGKTVTFTTDTHNPGPQNVDNTTQKVYLSGDYSGTTGLNASEVTLSYADGGTNNKFVPMTPTGTTANGGYIEADLDPGSVVNYPAGASNPITFKLSLAKTAPDSVSTGVPLTIDSEFDQVNQASDASTNLAYDVGSTFVDSPISAHYKALGGASSFLGAPTGPEHPVGNGQMQTFRGGNIYYSSSTGAFEVHGAILGHYQVLGGPTGFLGFPTSDELATRGPGGRFNSFQNAGDVIDWSPATGAFEVGGAIQAHYYSLGGTASFLGFPTSDELPTRGPGGRFNSFQNQGAVIDWSPATGAFEVQGAIQAKYYSLGGTASFLGFPTSDEFQVGPAGRRSNFQHGYIFFSFTNGAVTVG